jgi:hypothetical protein
VPEYRYCLQGVTPVEESKRFQAFRLRDHLGTSAAAAASSYKIRMTSAQPSLVIFTGGSAFNPTAYSLRQLGHRNVDYMCQRLTTAAPVLKFLDTLAVRRWATSVPDCLDSPPNRRPKPVPLKTCFNIVCRVKTQPFHPSPPPPPSLPLTTPPSRWPKPNGTPSYTVRITNGLLCSPTNSNVLYYDFFTTLNNAF